ncbi:MAG: hypothetical protein M1837_003198 [Sclerophora amabilis]|nr:MAG: hypothetical protein M1837_003198 [Sclerophora amabilis]
MKYSVAAVALLVAAINAQLPDVPKCSLTCFTTALTSDGCDSLTDFECHCSKPQLVSQITPCVEEACSPEEQKSVQEMVSSTCKKVGVPLDIPSEPEASAPASSAPSAPEESAYAPPSPSTTAAYTTPPTTASPSSYTPYPSGSGGLPGTSALPFTGAASQPTGAFGMVVAVAAAAAYAL